jgi:hypothetical protein
MKECWQKIGDICCKQPCSRIRQCKHPCKEQCGKQCESVDCKLCELELKKQIEATKTAARKRIEECEKKIKDGQGFRLTEVNKNGISTAAQYLAVEDKVLKNILPSHNWFPQVTKIEEIINPNLEMKFEKAKLRCFGNYIEQKFHGSNPIGSQNIPKEGFLAPAPPKPGKSPSMYGQGTYFATDSSKSAQEIYTGGSNKILLCDVLLGKSLTVVTADNTLNLKKIRDQGFDSVFAPRDSKSTGGVLNDEFVIYDPDQALPRYIIHFAKTGTPSQVSIPKSLGSLAGQKFKLTKVVASRTIDMNDPYGAHFSRASGIFYQVAKSVFHKTISMKHI